MEYALYFTVCSLVFGSVFYVFRKVIETHRQNKMNLAKQAANTADNAVDDFMCIKLADGGTIIKTGDVSVRGRATK